jgi:hypothetical protein
MSNALGIYDGVNRIEVADQWSTQALRENMSLVAVDADTNELIGVSINAICSKNEVEQEI